ncbi:urease accessory protein UreF [Candidatus Nitrospira bockiana]
MKTTSLLRGLRFIDSFFPSGGFAFSSGLEAAVHAGAVRNGGELSRYVEDLLVRGIGPCDGAAVGRAHEAGDRRRPDLAIEADRELDSLKVSRESRQASRQMGRQVVRLAFMEPATSTVNAFLAEVEADRTPGHLAIAIGLTLSACGWSREQAVAGFLYHTAVGFVSASFKLLPIGQREGQRLLDSWVPLIEDLSRQAASTSRLTAWCPVQDVYSMRHSRLTSRLFRS